jgi:hypothetical protein
MTTLINADDRAALRTYERSRENGSDHERALRIAIAAWRINHPHAAEHEADVAVRSVIRTAYVPLEWQR